MEEKVLTAVHKQYFIGKASVVGPKPDLGIKICQQFAKLCKSKSFFSCFFRYVKYSLQNCNQRQVFFWRLVAIFIKSTWGLKGPFWAFLKEILHSKFTRITFKDTDNFGYIFDDFGIHFWYFFLEFPKRPFWALLKKILLLKIHAKLNFQGR